MLLWLYLIGAAATSNVLLTGYWYPTNEMLKPFHAFPLPRRNNSLPTPAPPSAGGAGVAWEGRNWENRGYNIYSFYPTFDPPESTGVGTGDFMVDYQNTSTDWWLAVGLLKPVAIITFSRGSGGSSWVLESRTKDRKAWTNDYINPKQPTPAPPDPTVPPETIRYSSLPMQKIVDAVHGELGLEAWINTGDNFAGGFLSEFIGYHGMWYHDTNSFRSSDTSNGVRAAGHIHVGIDTPLELAIKATEISLRTLLDSINGY